MRTIDLSGSWRYITDTDDSGIAKEYFKTRLDNGSFIVPGSTCENGIGKKQEYFDELSKDSVRAPREKYEYIAPIWLQREIEIPSEFEGKHITLFLERVNIASDLWLDGVKIDRQIIELSAPHIYNLTGRLTPGTHTLTLRIDNRNLLNIDTMASGYSIDTQGYWNGIIGRAELRCEDIFRLENIQVYPNENGIDIRLVETSDVHSPFETKNAELEIYVTAPDGRVFEAKTFARKVFNSRQVEYLSYQIDDIEYWDEFNPALYTLTVRYSCNGCTDEKSVRFGMRTIKTEGRKILLNGRQISLRGTIDCAIYPLTGYPPMDIETWRRNFKTIKSYGLNHVRFHAWCPPENAFNAADELGLYISVEMPLWLNRDVCALELGEDSAHRSYYTQEAITISKTYGNHPCFIMFSNGNENMGDFELLEDIIIQTKAYDKRRLYTLTTNFDHPLLPCEDYLCAYEAGGHRVRIQTSHDKVSESTCLDYSIAVNDVPVPIISFEIGQYCVYPDVDGAIKYTGNILPTNLDAIKKEMLKKNVYDRLSDYINASGDLALKLYKEDIEAAMRTKDFGGFELLSLCDYTGQSTATVGILDVFFDSKGLTTPNDFRRFCNTVVPLFKARRIFTNSETLEAELCLYDFGKEKIENPEFELKIYNGDALFYEARTTDTKVSVPLSSIDKPSCLRVTLGVNGYENSWKIYVFTESKTADEVKIIKTKDELDKIIKTGGKAIVSTDCFEKTMNGSFIPVFWSPVHFPSQKPCGAIIDESHPIFRSFPTERYPDYQWKKLLDNSKGLDISGFGASFKPIVETVPNFVDNTPGSPLFEIKAGKARLLFCGFDPDADDAPARQLKASIISYVNSEEFEPEYEYIVE